MQNARGSRIPIALLALLTGCAAAPGPAEAETQAIPAEGPAAEAATRVQQLFDSAAAISGDESLPADARRAQIDHLLEPFLDPTLLALVALGSHAERFDRDEFTDFSYECARFVTTSLLRRFASTPGEASQVESARFDAERGVVLVTARGTRSLAGYPGLRRKLEARQPVEIELALRQRREEWRLIGMRRGGVDLGRSFREQFAAALEQEDPSAVIAQLRERNRQDDASNPFDAGQ